ncbi:DUF2177 family protein [Arthrobacter sp. H5]|uniref:DUF2177 family protein n=1 Tax=Arthrobacter sp. H5 TaxID=1267973 RepID=UPI0004ADD20B|nr:DUF2177 family protein [Arthrobacter sp. H5]
MIRFARNAAVVAVVFLAIDIPWLLLMAGTYREWIGPLMAERASLGFAAVFYLGYAATAYWLAVKPALEKASGRAAAVSGAVVGFAAYGTYGFTNAATLRDWPVEMLVIDTIWGTALTGTTCLIAYLVVRRLDRRTTTRKPA